MPPILLSSRPDFIVDGQPVPDLGQGLQQLELLETTEGLARCEVSFSNWGLRKGLSNYLYFDRRTLEFGKPFQVNFAGAALFVGRIMGLEATFADSQTPTISVLAEDRFQDLRMTRRTRSFENISDSELVRQIASDHSLNDGVDLAGPTYARLTQVNQSDLAFLRERMRSAEAELWIEGTTLHAVPRARRQAAPLSLALGSQLHSFTVLADLAHQRSSVIATGWNVSAKSPIQCEASDSVISGELNGDTSGATILNSTVGTLKEVIAHAVPSTPEEATTIAESHFKQIARRFLTGRGVADTQAGLKVGAVVNLANLGPLFSGQYYVTQARHRFDATNGLRTEFTAERPGLGRP